ncbi:MAG: molybdopterin-guanine dinucleotide biosynthesis protein B [Salinirussus sp.]
MYPLRIVGPSDSGKTTLVERLVPALREHGRVATVKHLRTSVEIDEPGKDTYRHRAAGADSTFGLEDDRSWFATGAERTLFETLRDLAPRHDVALVEGYSSEPRLPAVVLANRDFEGEAILTASSGTAVDVDLVRNRLESQPQLETTASLEAAESADADHATASLSRHIEPASAPQNPADVDLTSVSTGLTDRSGVTAVRVHIDPYGAVIRILAVVIGREVTAVGEAIGAIGDRLARHSELTGGSDNGSASD